MGKPSLLPHPGLGGVATAALLLSTLLLLLLLLVGLALGSHLLRAAVSSCRRLACASSKLLLRVLRCIAALRCSRVCAGVHDWRGGSCCRSQVALQRKGPGCNTNRQAATGRQMASETCAGEQEADSTSDCCQ